MEGSFLTAKLSVRLYSETSWLYYKLLEPEFQFIKWNVSNALRQVCVEETAIFNFQTSLKYKQKMQF